MDRQNFLQNLLPRERTERAGRLFRDTQVDVLSCVFWQEREDWSVASRVVPDILLLWPLEGVLHAEVNGEQAELGPGELLMVPEGVRHQLAFGRGCKHLDQIAIHCFIHNTGGLPLLAHFHSPFQTVRHSMYWFEQLKRLVCVFNQDIGSGRRLGASLLKQHLFELILDGAGFRGMDPSLDPRILPAAEMIEERYMEDLSVAELAVACGLSEVHFRKLFKQGLQAGPRAFLIMQRIRKAAGLLRSSSLTVKQIALQVGFKDDHYFHLSFKKAYGRTPSQYRSTSGGAV